MAFTWLPDPEAYKHPRLSWLIECGFEVAVWALYRREKLLPPGFRLHAGTLVVANHQRESDVPILTTAMCRHAGPRILDPLPFFAMREDLLHHDALARLLWTWPRCLAHGLALIPLGGFFDAIRTRPIRRVRELTVGEILRTLIDTGLGDAPPEAVLNARGLRELAAQQSPLPPCVRDIGPGVAWRTFWGWRRLRRGARKNLEPEFRKTIAAQIECFASLLAEKRTLFIAPEGTVSPDGHFGRVRALPWEVLRRLSSPPPVRPLGLSYDALAPGRLRAVVRVGAPFAPPLRSRREFDAELRARILQLCALTPSHLLAHWLVAGPPRFTTHELSAWLQRGLGLARDAGLTLDSLWLRASPEELARERLAWLRRKRLVVREAGAWRNRWPHDASPGWNAPENVVPYLKNNLEDFAPQIARARLP